ncbi:MAG: hypothetical protein IPM35_19320 [Myxococcales bacterium]|nr:hypothetical protein [Myxococcales bacterium]
MGELTETEWAETEERIRRETETTIASAFEAAHGDPAHSRACPAGTALADATQAAGLRLGAH